MPTYVPFRDLPDKILLYYAGQAKTQTKGHIVASMLGHLCDRRIWLDWQGTTLPNLTHECSVAALKHGKRVEQFERDTLEEERLITALQRSGYLVTHLKAKFSVLDGNFQGQIDGIIFDPAGPRYVLAVKSVSEKAFRALCRMGVKKAIGSYYLECQMYMHFFKVLRTLLVVVNKNNGEIYRSILTLDEDEVEKGLQKIHRIVMYGKNMPAALCKPNTQPLKLPCKTCDFVNFCYPKKAAV